MKSIKFFAIAAAALTLASCSNIELDSAKQVNNAQKPLEFTMVVKNQTRAGQIYSTNLNKLYMTTVGTFYSAAGAEVVNPTLELTKGEQGWSYIYNGNEANTILYWPMEGLTNAQFRAWYYDGATAAAQGELNNKTATLDAVGAYTALDYVSGEMTVPLSMYHAVSKAEFKAKVLTKSADGPYKIKVDVKSVCLHNMGYKASAYVLPESEVKMGALTLADGKRDLLVSAAEHAFIGQTSAAATIGSMFVMPQTVEPQALGAGDWTKPYISVLAQIRVDETGNDVPIFPKNAGENDYAWLAVPLPADFAGFQAHHKYIFTINLRDDAMGKADKDQYPNKEEMDDPNNPNEDDQPCGPNTEDIVPQEDRGDDIVIEGRSAFELVVTVEDVFDFDEYPEGQQSATEIEINEATPGAAEPASITVTWDNSFISALNLMGSGQSASQDGVTTTWVGDGSFYCQEEKGNTINAYDSNGLSFSCGSSYQISKIEITHSGFDMVDDSNWSVDGTKITWESTPAQSVILKGWTVIEGITQIVFTLDSI